MLDRINTTQRRRVRPAAGGHGVLRLVAWCAPTAAFVAMRRAVPAGLCFLDSADDAGPRSRWSYLAIEPARLLVAEDPADAVSRLDKLAGLLAAGARPTRAQAPPFTGGAIGLIGYDAARALHGLRSRHPRGGLPALHMGI